MAAWAWLVFLSHNSSHIQPQQTVNTPGWLMERSSACAEAVNLRLRDRISAGVLMERQAAASWLHRRSPRAAETCAYRWSVTSVHRPAPTSRQK